MIRKKPISKSLGILIALLVTVPWVTIAFADSIPPQINMNVPQERYEPGVIKTMVVDDSDISRVTLFYRKHGEGYYNSIDMKQQNDIYYRELNKELGLEGTVEYYILAQDTSGNQVTEPRMDPEENPLRAAAGSETNISAPEVMISNPLPGSVLDTGDESVMVTFYMTEREVDFNTIRFKIDKRDRTQEIEFFGNILVWTPRRALTNGDHEIEVIAKDLNGDYIGPNIWTFKVKTKRELPLGAEGDFYLGIMRDNRSGDSEVPLWDNKIDLGIKGQTGWVNWNAGIMLSSEETAFLTSESLPDRQPINRFYLDGRSRHFRFRLGDSNPNFSELSLKGILVRGANLELMTNRVQAQFVMGYNKREIGEQIQIISKNVTPDAMNPSQYIDENGEVQTITSSYQEIIQDPVTGRFHVYEYTPGTFKRNVTALQADVIPIKSKWATWKVGFNFFSAEDDTSTMDFKYDPASATRYYSYKDSTFTTDYKPVKNWAGTFETSIRFNDNRSELAAEFGGTLATENMFGTINDDLKDELPEEIKDDLFRFNASTQTSFDKQKLSDDIGAGATDAIKSVYKLRLTTPVPIPKAPLWFKGELYRIPTHYISLGNPQQKTDIGGMKFDLRARVLRDQITLNVGYDAYSDNLDNERKQYSSVDTAGAGLGQKDLTKDTNSTSFSVSVTPRMFAEYQPNVTLGYRTYTARNDLDLNIAANDVNEMIDTSSNTMMLSFGGMLPIGMQKHMGNISITNMTITDDRPMESYMLNESSNLTLMVNVNSSIDPLPLTVNTSVGRTSNISYRPLMDEFSQPYDRKEVTTGITMFNLTGTYKWFRDKRLSTSAGLALLASSNGETDTYEVDNTKTSFKVEADYKLTSVMSVGAQVRYISYTDNANSVNDYTEPILGFNLRSAF